MSSFPAADPEGETPYIDVEGQQYFPRQDMTSPARSSNDDCEDYDTIFHATTHGLPNLQTMAWATPSFDGPQGLGLQYPMEDLTTAESGPSALIQPAPTTFTWPADFTPTHTPTAQHFRRLSSWSSSFEPAPTVQPSQLWESLPQPTGLEEPREMSPEHSEHSASSYQSTSSSPFVSPARYGGSGLPVVKMEEHEPSVYDFRQFREASTVESRSGFDARDFAVSTPASASHRLSAGYPSASDPDAEDVKPSVRPGYRRAFSAVDSQDVEFEFRRKRSLTRPENASCSCDICGKPFMRSYNLKAHMETHDANRSMPNKCMYADCGKRFVRRTDLIRHTESVHVRSRPYSCARCHNAFARKDTLQRHLDDGCSMRSEVKKSRPKRPRTRTSPTIKEEPLPQTPESLDIISPADIARLQQS